MTERLLKAILSPNQTVQSLGSDGITEPAIKISNVCHPVIFVQNPFYSTIFSDKEVDVSILDICQ